MAREVRMALHSCSQRGDIALCCQARPPTSGTIFAAMALETALVIRVDGRYPDAAAYIPDN